jgi:hypothetical protein
VPGCCKGKAHDADHLGYAGRRVLVSAGGPARHSLTIGPTAGLAAVGPWCFGNRSGRYAWEPVAPTDLDHMEHTRRLLHAVADRAQWQAALAEARRWAATEASPDPSATGRAA